MHQTCLSKSPLKSTIGKLSPTESLILLPLNNLLDGIQKYARNVWWMVCLRSLIFLVDKKAEKLCLFSSFIRALDSICTKVFSKAQSSNDLGEEETRKKGGFFLVNGFLCSSRDTLEGLLSLSKEGVVAASIVVEILWIAFLSPTGMQRNDRQGTRLSSPLLPLFYPGSKGISNLVACSMSPERQKKSPFAITSYRRGWLHTPYM